MSKETIIISEEAYSRSIWGKQILSGLVSELKKKRINFTRSFDVEDTKKDADIYLIGTGYDWLNHAILLCNSKAIVPIVLCSQSDRIIRGHYHCVCADTYGLIQQLYDKFAAINKTRLALYGVNPASISDASRMECFLQLISNSDFISDSDPRQNSNPVFRNNGSLEECFRSFLPHAREYDAVICVNSYAAISLVRRLETVCPEFLGALCIVSYAETHLSAHYSKWLTFIDMNLEHYGKAALSICEMTENQPYLSNVTVAITGKAPHIQPNFATKTPVSVENQNLFYEDSELISMASVEYLLNECTDLDREIIHMLLQDATYMEIADTCFLSERAVKYHVKKYMEICGVRTKPQLLALLKEFLS